MPIQGLEIRHRDWIFTRCATVTCHIFLHSSLHLSSMKGEEISSKRTQERASTHWHTHYSRTYWHTLSLNLLLYICYISLYCSSYNLGEIIELKGQFYQWHVERSTGSLDLRVGVLWNYNNFS